MTGPKRSIGRRGFMARSLALGCSAAASPFLTPVTLAAAPGDNRLVVIILRGGMDGLDVLRPVGDRAYAGLRGGLAAGRGGELDGFFTLHPGLAGLAPLWAKGELGFVHATSTPYRDKRSHFDGQDMLEAGTGMDVPISAIRDGWLNRMLQSVPGVTARTAFAVGREDLLILEGDVPVSSWSPDIGLELSDQGRLLLGLLYAGDPVFAQASGMALDLANGSIDMAGGDQGGDTGGDMDAPDMGDMVQAAKDAAKAGRAKALADFAAKQLRGDSRIAAFSLNGWDTHRRQKQVLGRALGELETAILTLRDGLGPDWSRTSVLAMTEFGRTARENGSAGTDHGTGGAVLMAGGALRGGRVYGRWPGLGTGDLYAERDLMPTTDVRAWAGSAMQGLFGLDRGVIESAIFPGLDMSGVSDITL